MRMLILNTYSHSDMGLIQAHILLSKSAKKRLQICLEVDHNLCVLILMAAAEGLLVSEGLVCSGRT